MPQEMTANGTSYTLAGPSHAPVIVFIHGLGLSRRLWQGYEAAISLDYRVLTYDLFGHGDSVCPPSTPTLTMFSEQLFDLLEVLSIDACVLIGFSLGGMINRRFAIDHIGRVRALVIFNAPHERTATAQAMSEAHATDDFATTIERALERWFTPAFRAAQPNIVAQIREEMLAHDPAVYAQCRRVLIDGVAELIRPQPPIMPPALVMTCEHDRGSTPQMAYAMSTEMACAQTVIVPHLQHMGLLEVPQQFIIPLRRFLHKVV